MRRTGLEPVNPEGSGFTARRFCRSATDAFGIRLSKIARHSRVGGSGQGRIRTDKAGGIWFTARRVKPFPYLPLKRKSPGISGAFAVFWMMKLSFTQRAKTPFARIRATRGYTGWTTSSSWYLLYRLFSGGTLIPPENFINLEIPSSANSYTTHYGRPGRSLTGTPRIYLVNGRSAAVAFP